jgi:hypothetical protein
MTYTPEQYQAATDALRQRAEASLLGYYEAAVDLQCHVNALRANLQNVEGHLDELRDAWETGALSSHDGKNGYRSNINMAALSGVRKVLAQTAPKERP